MLAQSMARSMLSFFELPFKIGFHHDTRSTIHDIHTFEIRIRSVCMSMMYTAKSADFFAPKVSFVFIVAKNKINSLHNFIVCL